MHLFYVCVIHDLFWFPFCLDQNLKCVDQKRQIMIYYITECAMIKDHSVNCNH